MRTSIVTYVILLWLSEVLSSLAVWKGTPSDWVGSAPTFWGFETWRLKSWALFVLCSLIFWLIAWYSLRRRISAISLALLGAILAVSIEVSTSISFWRRLPWRQANYLGLSFFPRYFWEHLGVWIVTMSAGLALNLFWTRGAWRSGRAGGD